MFPWTELVGWFRRVQTPLGWMEQGMHPFWGFGNLPLSIILCLESGFGGLGWRKQIMELGN